MSELREDLLDNPNIRKLAKQLYKIPGVILVRWNPPWRPTISLENDPNAVVYTLITADPHPNKEYVRTEDAAPFMGKADGFCLWTKGVGQNMYEIEENAKIIYDSFDKAITDYLK